MSRSYISKKNIIKRKPPFISSLKILAGIMTSKKAFIGPLKVQISPINVCNNRCLMCRDHSPLVREKAIAKTDKKLMKMDLFTRLTDSLHKMGTKEMQLCGRGEPLLHPEILDMVSYVKSKGILCYITTNGSLLNKASVGKLVECGLNVLNVSINASNAETHSAIHQVGKGTFDTVTENLRYLTLAKAARKSQFPYIVLSVVILKQNWSEIVEMLTFADRVGAQAVNFIPAALDNQMKSLQLDESDLSKLKEKLVEGIKVAKTLAIQTNIQDLLNEYSYFSTGVAKSKIVQSQIPCYAGWIFADILEDGEVVPCCENYQSPLNGLSLANYSFEEIWNSDEYKVFRQMCLDIPKTRRSVKGCNCFNCSFTKNNQTIHRKLRFIVR